LVEVADGDLVKRRNHLVGRLGDQARIAVTASSRLGASYPSGFSTDLSFGRVDQTLYHATAAGRGVLFRQCPRETATLRGPEGEKQVIAIWITAVFGPWTLLVFRMV
jgi:hypothetical protein